MQYFWLNKEEKNKKLIVFFNGWGMNETPVKHLKTGDYNVLVLFDYMNLDIDFSQFEFERYDEKILICWSMGVYAVNNFKKIFDDFKIKIAINGTPKLIDDKFGIPQKIYNITAKLLNADSLEKFIKNMFDNGKMNPNITITRTLEQVKEELNAIKRMILKEYVNFNKAIISSNDKIIPTKNQINFWSNRAKVCSINSTHCPFENYSSWQEIINA